MKSSKDIAAVLTADLKPVRPTRMGGFLILWIIFSGIISAFYLNGVGIRADLASKLTSFNYAFALGLFSLVYAASAMLCFKAGIPGQKIVSFKKVVSFFVGAFIISILFYGGVASSSVQGMKDFIFSEALWCCLRINFGMLLPLVVMSLISAKIFAPVKPKQMFAFMTINAAVLVSIVSQINCPYDSFEHIFVGHGMLLIATSAIMYFTLSFVFANVLMFWELRRAKALLGNLPS